MSLIQLHEVQNRNNKEYLDLLLLADESEEIVKEYLFDGELYVALNQFGNTVGIILMIPTTNHFVEIKNMAVSPNVQGKGYGKAIISEICNIYKLKGYPKILVGTANSSINNLAFYQKAGFRITHIHHDFFSKYPDPIWENGIRALDMVMLEKVI